MQKKKNWLHEAYALLDQNIDERYCQGCIFFKRGKSSRAEPFYLNIYGYKS